MTSPERGIPARSSPPLAGRHCLRNSELVSLGGVKFFRFVLISFLAASIVQTVGARHVGSKVKTILILGDSLTAGFGLSRNQAYPAVLSEKMRGISTPIEVINAGENGDTTAGALRRLPNYLRRPIDVLIIELGINDAFRGVPNDEMQSNLQGIIDQTRIRFPKVEVVIAGMQLPMYVNDPYVHDFGEMFSALAKKNNAALVPFLLEGVGGDPTLNQQDRIHPNAAGQRVLAENIWRVLEPVLRRVTAVTSSPTNAAPR